MKHTNPQVEQMTSFIVMDVLERANELQKQGVDIIHLEVGEPDFDVPSCASEAAKAAYDLILLTIHILWGTRNSGGKLLLFIYGNME